MWQRRLGLAIMVAGALLLLVAGADKAMAAYRQQRLQRQADRLFGPAPAASPAAAEPAAASPVPAAAGPATAGVRRLGESLADAVPAPGSLRVEPPPAPPAPPPPPKPSLVPPGSPLPLDSGPLVGRGGLQAETPLFRLLIPAIDVENVVVEGSTEPALRLGPGHLEGTALPGEAGNVVLAGHRDYFFWGLGDLKVGDPIYLQARRGFMLYQVAAKQVVKDTDVWVLGPTPVQTLTLITCYPLIHPGYTDQRLVVFAERVG